MSGLTQKMMNPCGDVDLFPDGLHIIVFYKYGRQDTGVLTVTLLDCVERTAERANIMMHQAMVMAVSMYLAVVFLSVFFMHPSYHPAWFLSNQYVVTITEY